LEDCFENLEFKRENQGMKKINKKKIAGLEPTRDEEQWDFK
jgi:hypothetical protein